MLDKTFIKLQALPLRTVFAAAIAFIVLEYVALGKYSLFIVGDNISVLPYYLAFFSNNVPFANWTPFATTGTDMMATGYHTLVFQWMFATLPPWLAFQVLVIAPILAGIFGVYGLCRKVFNLDRPASAFAGCAYGIIFFRELFFLSAVPGYLPLTLLALHYLLEDKSNLKGWLAVIVSGFLISHSSFITRLVPWPVATYVVWFLIIEKRRRPLDLVFIAVFCVAIIAARWQDIIALLSYAPLSALSDTRSGGTFDIEMHKVLEATKASLLGPWGIIAILLAGFALCFTNKAQRPMAGRLGAAMAALLGLLFAGVLVKVAAVSVFAFLNGFNITYVLQGFGLIAVIAGGMGWQFISQRTAQSPGLRWLPVLMVGLLLTFNLNTKIRYAKDWVSWGNFHQNTQNPALLDLARTITAQGVASRALSFQMHGSLLNSYGLETIEGYHPLTAKRYLAFWQQMVAPWRNAPGWLESHGRAETGALTSILPSTLGGKGSKRTELQAQWRLADFVNMNLLSLINGGYVVSRDRLTDDQLELVSGPERSWSTLSQKDKILTNLAANFNAQRPVFIYRNSQAMARAFTVDRVRNFSNSAQLLKALSKADQDTLARTVFTDTAPVPTDLVLSQPDVISLDVGTDTLSVEIGVTPLPTILVISNSYSPYWKCQANGQGVTLFPANSAFWGLLLPAGTKKTTCDYRPPYLISR